MNETLFRPDIVTHESFSTFFSEGDQLERGRRYRGGVKEEEVSRDRWMKEKRGWGGSVKEGVGGLKHPTGNQPVTSLLCNYLHASPN